MSSKESPTERQSSPQGVVNDVNDPGGLLLTEAMQMLEPLVSMLVSEGVGYPSVTRALRASFIEVARRQLLDEQSAGGQAGQPTDAAVSLRSGVHRKEVRAASEARAAQTERATEPSSQRTLSLAGQVFTRWTTDTIYCATDGAPATLAFSGPAPSFDSLVSAVTRDFSKRSILDELIRLGLVRCDGDQIVPIAAAMVPSGAWSELVGYLGDHIHDHLAAGTANLRALRQEQSAPFLEHSMYVNGISDASIEQLSALARTAWKPAFNQMVGAARQRYELEQKAQRKGRLRFGVYLYSEPDAQASLGSEPAEPVKSARSKQDKRKKMEPKQ